MQLRRWMLRIVALCTVLATGALLFAQNAYDEPWRPQFHFTPARNFMNDPNGLVFYKGEYHLFYQYNPEGNTWGHMNWGQAVSNDMLHWKQLPVAISEVKGKYMIYSGSVVVDRDNTSGLCAAKNGDKGCLVAIYTAAVRDAGKDVHQSQYLSYSNDRGRTWTEYPGNPVADLGKPDFRDPKVFWYAPQKKWVMVAVLADERKVEIFDSHDLKKWKRESEFGPAGDTVGQWECPDLFELPVEGSSESKWVLVINRNPGAPAGGTGTKYLIGSFDGDRFAADAGEGQWADYGKDFYATQRFSSLPPADTRTVWMGWISNWQYANKEPTDIWRGAQSLPRALSLKNIAGRVRLVQSPISETKRLREKSLMNVSAVSIAEANRVIQKAAVDGDTLEIEIAFAPATAKQFGIMLRKGPREETTVGFSRPGNTVFVDRTHSGDVGFSKDFPGRQSAPVFDPAQWSLHIFVDRSSVETFVNGGETVLTDRIYPALESRGIQLFSDSPRTKIVSMRVWKLSSIWRKNSSSGSSE